MTSHRQLLDHILERTKIETSLNEDEYDDLLHEITSLENSEEEDSESVGTTASGSSRGMMSDEVDTASLLSSPSSLGIHIVSDTEDLTTGAVISPVIPKPRAGVSSPESLTEIPRYSVASNLRVRNQEATIAALRLEIQQKKLDIENIHREYRLKLVQMEESFDNERHNAEIEVIRLKSISQENEKKLQKLQAQTRKHVENLEAKISQLEKDRLLHNQLKDNFANDLTISDSQYVEIKNIKEEEQTVKEFVQSRVYEIISEFKQTISSLKRENSTLSENLQRTAGEFEKLKAQTNYIHKLKDELERQYKSDLELEIKKNEKLSTDLSEKIKLIEEFRAKAEMYDNIKKKSHSQEGKLDKYTHKMEILEAQLHNSQKEHEECVHRLSSISQQLELVKNDKMYLTRENETLAQNLQKLQDDYERLNEKLKETKTQKKEYYERLLSFKDETKLDADRNMQSEVKKMREKMKKDLHQIKQNAQEAFDRELRILREGKEHAETQCEKLRMNLQESKEAYDMLTMEYSTLKHTMEKQLNELNSQLNLHTFKNETLNVSLLEVNSNLKQCQSENEVMRKKIDVLKSGYYKLQTDSEKRIAQLETQLESITKELSNYHDIEKELDKALEGVGNLEDEAEKRTISDMTSLIPTNATRRMKYSLFLVRKVSDLEKHIDDLKKDIAVRDHNLALLNEQLNKSKANLEKVSQPYNYLVSAIETKEQHIEKQQQIIINLEKDVRRLKENNEKLMFEKHGLERDLDQLLNQKTVLNKLKVALSEIQSESRRIDKAVSSAVSATDKNTSANLQSLISQLMLKNNVRNK